MKRDTSIYETFAKWWLNTDLFKGVAQRYQPNIMMTKLPSVNVAKLQEAIEAISSVFDKACRYIASHSQPLETLNVRPTLDELKADWEVVQEARKNHV